MLKKITLIFSGILSFFSVIAQDADINSVKFQSLKIGQQVWAAVNLDVDRFQNGDIIPEVKTPEEWESYGKQAKPAWCYYQNDAINGKTYGKLYNWYAVTDPRGLAPEGWHIAGDEDWKLLLKFLDPKAYLDTHGAAVSDFVGGILKEKGTKHWTSPNKTKNKNIEFNALPSGYRDMHGAFHGIGTAVEWWSSTTSKMGIQYVIEIINSNPFLYNQLANSSFGCSIRLVKNLSDF